MDKLNNEFQQNFISLIQAGELNKGLIFLEKIAKDGYLWAQEEIGITYFFGYYGNSIDYEKSKYWFEKSIDNNGSVGYYYLGYFFFFSLGKIDRNIDHSIKLFEQAHSKGVTEATNFLGERYYEGIHVQPDFNKAKKYFEIAYGQDKQIGSFGLGLVSLFEENQEFKKYIQVKNYFEISSQSKINKLQQKSSVEMVKILDNLYDIQKDSYKIWDINELVKKLDTEHKKGFYYRGQTNGKWKPLCSSLYRQKYSTYPIKYTGNARLRQTGTIFHFQDLNDSNSYQKYPESKKIQIILNDYLRAIYGYPLINALFQQAGYQSEGLDITFDLFIALFFASYEYEKSSGSYKLVANNNDQVSVIYRWKNLNKPDLNSVMQANYFDCSNLIPTYEIFESFERCDSIDDFFISIKNYAEAINFGTNKWDVDTLYRSKKRPFKLLKIPDFMWQHSRIYKQKAGLLLSDYIMGEAVKNQYKKEFGVDEQRYIADLPLNLRQDLSGDDICESFYFKVEPAMSKKILAKKGITPNDLYNDSEIDFSHLFLNGWLEHIHDFAHSFGIYVVDPGPRPQYGHNYYSFRQKLKDLQIMKSKLKYYFE